MKTKITQEQIEKLKESNNRLKQKAENLNKKFKNELKTSLRTAIVAAFGILIALQWKELITELVNKISSISPIQGTLVTTAIITIISVLGIVVTTELLSNREEKKD
jgi:H+/gluconate symporter-like permease